MNVSLQPRPRIKVPLSKLDRFLWLSGFLVLIGTIVYLIYHWNDLPSRIVIHFNGRGEADGWGSKGVLWIIPAISAVLFAGLTVLMRYPHAYNYPVSITENNAAEQYAIARQMLGWINLEIMALFAYIVSLTVRATQSNGGGNESWSVWVIVAVIVGTIAIYMVRSLRAR